MSIDRSSSISSGSTWGEEFDGGVINPSGPAYPTVDEITVENSGGAENQNGDQRINGGDDGEVCCANKLKWCCVKGLSGIRKLWATNQTEDTKNNKDIRMRLLIRELIIFIIFLFLISFVAFNTTSPTKFYFTKTIAMTFLNAPIDLYDSSVTFKNMKDIQQWYQFASGPLLNGLYPPSIYGTKSTTTTTTTIYKNNITNSGTSSSSSSSSSSPPSSSSPLPSSASPPISPQSPSSSPLLLQPEYQLYGVPRIRLVRSTNGTCRISSQFDTYQSVYCYNEYSYNYEDKNKFGPMNSTAWFYQAATQLNSSLSSYRGKLATYSEAGFIQDLNVTYEESKRDLDNLQLNDWLVTGPTRAVFIDFSLYNANVDLLCVVRLLSEFPTSGSVVSSWSLKSFKFIRYVTVFDYVVLAFEIIIIVFLIYYMIEEIIEIHRLRWTYLKSFFNINDITIVILLIICMTLNVYKTSQMSRTFYDNYRNDSNGYVIDVINSGSSGSGGGNIPVGNGSQGNNNNITDDHINTDSSLTTSRLNASIIVSKYITTTTSTTNATMTTNNNYNNSHNVNDDNTNNNNNIVNGVNYIYGPIANHVDLNSASQLETIFEGFVAVALFCCWIKLFKFIGFNRTMTQLSLTLSSCLSEVVTFTFIFVLAYASFALLAYFLFGSTVQGFSTYEEALYSQFKVILGDFNYDSLISTSGVLGLAYFIVVVFILLLLLASMFVAIISDAYGNVKMDLLQKRKDLELMDYIRKAYRKMLDKIDLKKQRNKNKNKSIEVTGKASAIQSLANDKEADGKNPSSRKTRFERRGGGDANGGDNNAKREPYLNESFDESEEEEDDDDSFSNHRLSQNRNLRLAGKTAGKMLNGKKVGVGGSGGGVGGGGGGGNGVGPEEFSMLQRRVDRMEHSIGSVVSKIDAILVKLESMEKMRMMNRDTMERLLNSVTESEGTVGEEFRQECPERLGQSILDHWDSTSGISGGPSPISSRDLHHHDHNRHDSRRHDNRRHDGNQRQQNQSIDETNVQIEVVDGVVVDGGDEASC